mgnify:CR=1 FL=1
MGRKPSERTSAPRFRSGSIIMSMGLRSMVPLPVTVMRRSQSAAMGVNSRVASPDSPVLTVSVTGARPPRMTYCAGPVWRTEAPRPVMTSMA